ncbi:MAG: DUF3159 domain-containing protein [Dehalococcoidia bacterium]|nr:DUF3159 domain-containing protein [Dehalococcoidia bacterium]
MSIRVPLRWWPGEPIVVRLRLVLSILPAWLFLLVSRFAPAWASISAGFGATVVVYFVSGHSRLVGAIATFGFGIAAIHAVFGIIFNDEKSYLAAGWVTDLLFVPVYTVSVVVRRPLVGGIAREMVPTVAGRLPLDATIYRLLSVFWAIFYVFHGAVQGALWHSLSVAEFVVWSRIVLWPPTTLALLASAWLIWRSARAAVREPASKTVFG